MTGPMNDSYATQLFFWGWNLFVFLHNWVLAAVQSIIAWDLSWIPWFLAQRSVSQLGFVFLYVVLGFYFARQAYLDYVGHAWWNRIMQGLVMFVLWGPIIAVAFTLGVIFTLGILVYGVAIVIVILAACVAIVIGIFEFPLYWVGLR